MSRLTIISVNKYSEKEKISLKIKLHDNFVEHYLKYITNFISRFNLGKFEKLPSTPLARELPPKNPIPPLVNLFYTKVGTLDFYAGSSRVGE